MLFPLHRLPRCPQDASVLRLAPVKWLRARRGFGSRAGGHKQQEMGWGDGRGDVCVCVFVLILQVAWAEPHATPGREPGASVRGAVCQSGGPAWGGGGLRGGAE